MHVRNHLISSYTQPTGGATSHMVFEYTNVLGCILAPIKPLREQREDIISPAGLYIDTPSQELDRQIVGVDGKAIAFSKQYDYPYDRTQSKRILKEAVIWIEEPYICAQTIQEVVRREDILFSGFPLPARTPLGDSGRDTATDVQNNTSPDSCPVSFRLNTSQPLDGMNQGIVRYMLRTCGGNQTSVARELGVSQTTL